NGYRTFHVLDIGTLLRCRSYSCFGLSLSEAADAINCNSVAETHALLVKQEKWLKKQTDYNLRMLNRLNDLNEVMSTCEREINRLSVVQHPGMFRVDYRHNDELLSGDAREDLLALWASFAPFSFVSLKFPLESIQRAEQDYFCGYGILEEDARYCGVCMDELVECFPSPAVHTIPKVVRRFRSDSYVHPLDFARENRLVHGGRVYAHGGHHHERTGLRTVYEVWLPVRPMR
ncbi:MAG: hypothetical protein ACLVJB_05695, partial [Christensenellales bacterium]